MNPTIRPARASDFEAIAAFTTDTFEWGDYIVDALPEWLADPDGRVMVAVDDDDVAVALGRGHMLSPTELWLQGARVSDAWRRQGLASDIGLALVEWGKGRGAQVARLITESWNTPAQRQVEKTGFARRGSWVVGSREIGDTGRPISTNGGQRAKARRKLELAHSSEAVPAWVSWRSGPLVGPSRGLYSRQWKWAQLSAGHLESAGRRGGLWSSQAGWALVDREEDRLAVGWLDCGPDDATDMIRSLVDLAFDTRAERLRVTVPEVDWLVAALKRSECELDSVIAYERPL